MEDVYTAQRIIKGSRALWEAAVWATIETLFPARSERRQCELLDTVLRETIDKPAYLKRAMIEAGLKLE